MYQQIMIKKSRVFLQLIFFGESIYLTKWSVYELVLKLHFDLNRKCSCDMILGAFRQNLPHSWIVLYCLYMIIVLIG